MADLFAAAQRIADAVLYEGYALYPYRASALKNRRRWQFGVVGPPSDDPGAEPSSLGTDLLVSGSEQTVVHVRVRFLHVQSRRQEVLRDAAWVPEVSDAEVSARWDEAVERTVDTALHLDGAVTVDLSQAAGQQVIDLDRQPPTRQIRDRAAIEAALRLTSQRVNPGLWRVRATVENRTSCRDEHPDRCSLVGVHLLVAAADGRLLSLQDPPEGARAAAADCRHDRCWPVLVGGADGDRTGTLVLAAPIILYDHPSTADRSTVDTFDGLEIEELLALRVQTLTEEEKDEVRATDPRAARLVDTADALGAAGLARLHAGGDLVDQDPGGGTVVVGGIPVRRGTPVVLRPRRRADAMDLFLAGRTAVVEGVHTDLDGATHVAVTVDDDPGQDLRAAYGRYFWFDPAEIEPLVDRDEAVAP